MNFGKISENILVNITKIAREAYSKSQNFLRQDYNAVSGPNISHIPHGDHKLNGLGFLIPLIALDHIPG